MNKNICEFQVSMQYIEIIYCFEPLNNLAHKKPSFLLRKSTSNLMQFFQVTTIAILHEEVKIIRSLLNIV